MIKHFFVGSYGTVGEDGIASFELDTEKKTLRKTGGFSRIERPSWILMNRARTRMYAVQEEAPEGCVHELKVEGLALTHLQQLPSGGADPCHLSLDAQEELLLNANYTSGSLTVYSLDGQGSITGLTMKDQHEGSGPNPVRQECAHVHFSCAHEGLFYVCDLGMDQVFVYERDECEGLKDTGMRIVLPDGCGPRHLAFDKAHPERIYVLCELTSAVAVYEKKADRYELLGICANVPEDFAGESTSASIRISGDLLFASNRGHDSITVYRILEDGKLERTCICPTGGKTPRDMVVIDDFLVIANQDSDLLSVLAIDRAQKSLHDTGITAQTVKPTCIAVY